MAAGRFEVHQRIDHPQGKAIDWLVDSCSLSRGQLKAALAKGAVWLTRAGATQRLRRATRVLNPGDELHLYYDPAVLAQSPLAAELVVDEGDYSVWNKPCGMLCQGSKYGDHTTLQRWAQQQLVPERPCFVVHRLDRATRGLVLLTHSKAAARALSGLFESRQLDKRYLARVHGIPPFDNELIERPVDGRSARSRATLQACAADGGCCLVEVQLETGRKHQIRQHLAALGYPIMGDRLYGRGEADRCDLQLQAYRLAFVCPITAQPRCYQLPSEQRLKLPDG